MARRVAIVAVALFVLLGATAAAKQVTGTPGADVIRGTPQADTLRGLGGSDLLDGLGGRDRFLAGGGGDRVQAFDGSADRVACGAGRDTVTADRSDVVARDCELVSTALSGDPFTGGPGQHRTQVEPHAAAAGNTVVATFQVARIEGGGAMGIGWASSRDAGRTWRSGLLPRLTTAAAPAGPWPRASDPVVAYDRQHGVWLAVSLALGAGDSALAVNRSRDARAWDAPVTVASASGLGFDKEWIACDNWPASPFYGRCYLSYTDVDTNTIATRYSSDGGLTWSGGVHPPGNAGQAGASGNYAPGVQPVVLPSGVVVIVYYDGRRMAAVRSTDGGASYTPAVGVAPISFDDTGMVRAAPLPTAVVDDAGTIYASWPDCAARAGCRGNDVVVTRSQDGITWSTLARASLGSGNNLLPALAATGTGRLALTYYVLAAGRLGVRTATSTNGGATWSSPQRLDTESMQLPWVASSRAAMVGDYVASVFAGTRSLSVFAFAARPNRGLRQAIFASAHG